MTPFIRYSKELDTLTDAIHNYIGCRATTVVLASTEFYYKIEQAIEDTVGHKNIDGTVRILGVRVYPNFLLPYDFLVTDIPEPELLKPEHNMRAAANAQLEGLTSFLEETLSKLGINVPVHLDEDEFAHNQTRFRVKTGSFKQTPVVHKESYLVSENSVMTYNCKKKTWKFKFDLKFENKDYGGGICYTPDAYMTVKGKFGINCPNDFIYLRAIINQK